MKQNQKGFSLVELLVVIVIIGVIAAIAIPNLIASRRSANEGSAQSTIRAIHSAQVTFASTNGNGDYAGDTVTPNAQGLADLAANTVDLLDDQLSTGNKSGFNFVTYRIAAAPNVPPQFNIGAVPATPNGVTATGTRKFCVPTDGVIRVDTSSLATNITDENCTWGNVVQ